MELIDGGVTTGDSVYAVQAKDRAEAVAKATDLATKQGHTVTGHVAERFSGGEDYGVNWKVRIYWHD